MFLLFVLTELLLNEFNLFLEFLNRRKHFLNLLVRSDSQRSLDAFERPLHIGCVGIFTNQKAYYRKTPPQSTCIFASTLYDDSTESV